MLYPFVIYCIILFHCYIMVTVKGFQYKNNNLLQQQSFKLRNSNLDESTLYSPKSILINCRENYGKVYPIVASILSLSLANKVFATERYLVDPTDEFKEEEKRTKQYNDSQLKIRKDWDVIIEKLKVSEDPLITASLLTQMSTFLSKLDGIPVGIKKLDIVKICRKKKFNGRKIKPNWTTDVEIVYEKFILDFNKKVAPEKPGSEKLF